MNAMSSRRRRSDPDSWRHVAITGGGSGLGAALARLFAGRGVSVSLIDRDADALDRVCQSLPSVGGRVFTCVCDVSSSDEMERCAKSAIAEVGDVDALFLCAAVGDSQWIRSFDAAALRRVMETNLFGIVNALGSFVPRMAARGNGTIVPISSLLDVRGYAGTAPYSASKAALRSLCDSARTLCACQGVRLVLVRPGFMATPLATGNQFRMPGMLTPERAAEIIVTRLARPASIIAFPRWLAIVAECIRLLPRPAYDALVRRLLEMEGLDDVLEYRHDSSARTASGDAVGAATARRDNAATSGRRTRPLQVMGS